MQTELGSPRHRPQMLCTSTMCGMSGRASRNIKGSSYAKITQGFQGLKLVKMEALRNRICEEFNASCYNVLQQTQAYTNPLYTYQTVLQRNTKCRGEVQWTSFDKLQTHPCCSILHSQFKVRGQQQTIGSLSTKERRCLGTSLADSA